MALFRLMLKNAARSRRRTALTVLGMAVSVFLLISLRTLLAELEGSSVLSEQSALRLITMHATSMQLQLPIRFGDRIQEIPGVEYVSPYQWVPGYYQDPKNPVMMVALDPQTVLRIGSEYTTSPAELAAFQKDRIGALVSAKLMQRYGWKVGEHVTILGAVFPFNVEVVIRGELQGPVQSAMDFHYDYFNELRRQYMPGSVDKVMSFWIKVRRPEDVPRVSAAIDSMFRNSEAPTRTGTEKSFLLSFTSMLGNVKLLMALIATAVTFAILLVTMNTMALSVRERTSEIAVLRTLGFRRKQVLGLLVGESLAIALAGGVLGVVSAKLVFSTVDFYKLTDGIIQYFHIRLLSIALGLGLSALLGIVSAAVPAWRAVNASIAPALRHVG